MNAHSNPNVPDTDPDVIAKIQQAWNILDSIKQKEIWELKNEYDGKTNTRSSLELNEAIVALDDIIFRHTGQYAHERE